jgi:hypothetical protein
MTGWQAALYTVAVTLLVAAAVANLDGRHWKPLALIGAAAALLAHALPAIAAAL